MKFGATAVLLLTSTTLLAQSDPWVNLRVFEGKWEGTATGEPGKGVTSRELSI